ncbi:hypothetical protein CLOM_g11719 [Closterium sp. NIES-68]|nr:hypothetical protein CLOM_g11719 [Closterium sp. NIES-68]
MLPTRFRDGRQRSSPSLCDVASSPRRRHAIFLSLLLVASSLTIVSAYSCSSVPGLALLEPKYLNRVSRYVSMGHDESCGCWHVFVDVDWRDLDGVKGVRSEGACKSSWAITAVNAVEATFAIVTSAIGSNDTIFNISVQQVVDCEPSSSSCKGGWPTSALDYMVDASQDQGGLVPEQAYPYKGKQAKCSGDKIAASSTPVGLARYEQVDYYGWIGLLLAVQVQPVIAFVRGSYPSFQKYRAGVYSDPKCAAAGIVDHSVLVVGYSFTGPDGEGHWIVRNSWGTKWGEKGHMRMSFAGGTGICGIHAVPAIYPIIQVPSPCDSPQKPCGGGECVPDGSGGYSCLCPTPSLASPTTMARRHVPPWTRVGHRRPTPASQAHASTTTWADISVFALLDMTRAAGRLDGTLARLLTLLPPPSPSRWTWTALSSTSSLASLRKRSSLRTPVWLPPASPSSKHRGQRGSHPLLRLLQPLLLLVPATTPVRL